MKLVGKSLILLFLVNFGQAQTIRNGEDLLRAMHDRYKDSWYQTVTFTQKSTTYKPDGTSSAETWYEAAMVPGRLRIDIGSARATCSTFASSIVRSCHAIRCVSKATA